MAIDKGRARGDLIKDLSLSHYFKHKLVSFMFKIII